MTVKRVIFLLLSVFLAILGFSNSFLKDLDTATNLALIENKKVVLFFEMKGCHYCEQMNKVTLKDEDVLKFLYINYIPVIIYSDEQPELFYIFKVRATPTMWFLEIKDGKVQAITYVPGFMPPDIFLKVLKYVYKLPKEDFREYSKKEDDFIGEKLLIEVSKEEADYVLKNDPNSLYAKSRKDFKGEIHVYVTDDPDLADWLIKRAYRVLLIKGEGR